MNQGNDDRDKDAELRGLRAELAAARAEHRKAEAGLRQMARAAEQSPASIVITDRAGNIQYVNAYFELATGYTRAEALGKNPRILKSGLTSAETYRELWNVITEGGEWRGELCNRRKNGEMYWEYAAISGMKDDNGEVSHYIAVKEEITERRQAEEALRVSLREKEDLLKETHHRVKNNLALISSLMRLEAGRSLEAETKAVLSGMQARIRSVVLLNETLYKTASYSHVKLANYLREIATHVFQAQNANPGAVRLVLDLEPVEVETGQAIPCGLIVNELLTNSLKHAFPGERSGEVRVGLRREADGGVWLRVSDTGAGLPEGFASRPQNSLGLQLVSDLTRQLRGSLEVGPGAAFTMTFSPERRDTGSLARPRSTGS
jgi:PAS domain S-box-containing protein